ncbi:MULTISPECIES: DUF4062 domain-containing protein [Bacillus subtilis group]|uniref:DUF4062 domain-containing protein n=1 Tax=Bacillus subtilis group TaxID=653685 RepID=UPI001B05F23C|nr:MULTISPECIES: DUF4062 domain-containing protein [Bacillus subtilis group]MED4338033.1 DUF4062 domain-containing protein [Bacillus licheniformis]MED4370963.1 DUF4062 domain-containing protein [Bacillus licheniformis]GIN55092.1 hypothetical protein J36TS2_39860 [Bacillus paralicheniformis]
MSSNLNSTRIFISSTAQETLQPLRQKLKERLEAAGHLPLLFEENFGLWSDDALNDCLDKVSESQVYLLFISDKSGSFTKVDPKITATYAEFHRAKMDNLIIIPIVESHIYSFFNEHIKEELGFRINRFIEENEREPDYTYDIVMEWFDQLPESNPVLWGKIEKQRVDPFNWAFIYDVFRDAPWTYNYPLVETERTCEFVLESLSKVLKQLSPYYNMLDSLDSMIEETQRLTRYMESHSGFIQCIKKGNLNVELLLNKLCHYLTGGPIHHNQSPLMKNRIATVNKCDAICLYKREQNGQDELTLVGYTGSSDPQKGYMINDEESYVASTYRKNNDTVENIYYNEEKQKIYLTKKLGDLVISAHFLLSEPWSETRVKNYEHQILGAIMKERDQFDLAIDLIGGMLNDN